MLQVHTNGLQSTKFNRQQRKPQKVKNSQVLQVHTNGLQSTKLNCQQRKPQKVKTLKCYRCMQMVCNQPNLIVNKGSLKMWKLSSATGAYKWIAINQAQTSTKKTSKGKKLSSATGAYKWIAIDQIELSTKETSKGENSQVLQVHANGLQSTKFNRQQRKLKNVKTLKCYRCIQMDCNQPSSNVNKENLKR